MNLYDDPHWLFYRGLLNPVWPPQRFDPDAALRIGGLREQVWPGDVHASLLPARRWALLLIRVNREVFGHPSWPPVPIEGGWLSICDLRPALLAEGYGPTPPDTPWP